MTLVTLSQAVHSNAGNTRLKHCRLRSRTPRTASRALRELTCSTSCWSRSSQSDEAWSVS